MNKFYFQNATAVSNRPLYVSLDGFHGIWYTGSWWIVGNINDLNLGKLTFGFLSNDEGMVKDVKCPVRSIQWREWYDNQWHTNAGLDMKCDGMLF